MTAATSPGQGRVGEGVAFRFGRDRPGATVAGRCEPEWGVEWLLKRNCSIAPRQLLMVYLSLCAVSLGIATLCWVGGARMVMPFAGLELLAVGAALLLYARHASDRECISLSRNRLTVERVSGGHVQRVELEPLWVRVEAQSGPGSLIELSGRGQRVVVGRHVRPEWRPRLAQEFRMALSAQRIESGGPTATN